MPASSCILTSKGPGVWGDEYQGAGKPLGQVAGSQNNTHPRAGSLSAEVHLQKRLPGIAGGRDSSLGAEFLLCNLLGDPPVLDTFPVTPFPPPLGSWNGTMAPP